MNEAQTRRLLIDPALVAAWLTTLASMSFLRSRISFSMRHSSCLQLMDCDNHCGRRIDACLISALSFDVLDDEPCESKAEDRRRVRDGAVYAGL